MDSDFIRKNGRFRNPLTAHEGWGSVSVPGLIFYNMIGYLSQKLAMLETSIGNLQTVTGLKNASTLWNFYCVNVSVNICY